MTKNALLASLLLLTGCMPEMDMQGVDPRDYYAQHPIANKVVEKTQTYVVVFATGQNKPEKSEVLRFREALYDRSLLSVRTVKIQLSASDFRNTQRRQSLEKMLRYLGYRNDVTFVSSTLASANEALMELTYSDVVAPDCPDWRQSPSHNFSNHDSANFGCATEVNLGLMVADPRDLQRGTGELPPVHSEHHDALMKAYRTGNSSSTSSSTGSTAASPAIDTTTAAPTSVPQ